MDRRLISTLVIILFLIPVFSIIFTTQPVAAQETGPKTDTINFKRFTTDQVKDALDTGQIDVYLFGVPSDLAQEMQSDPNVVIYTAAAGLVDYILNPAPVYIANYTGVYTKEEVAEMEGVPPAAITYYEVSEEGNWTYAEFGAHPDHGLNPFAFRKVRFAINYAFDREKIVESIYKGFAVPMYTFLSQYDPDFAVIADIVAKYRFSYDLDLAESMITDVLLAVGAERIGTYWYYNGQKITLKFIIRTEDERKQVGDLLATNLVRLGFDVQRLYLTFWDAIMRVYFTDPKDFEWHIYTEGWGKGGIDRYDYGTINQFGAPWYTWLPGWGESDYWNYRNSTIDEVCMKIYFGEFNSEEERNELYRRGTEMIIQEAVRIWVVTRLEVTPTRTTVKGVTLDLGAGLRGIWNLREMYAEDHPSTLNVGHLWVYTSRSVWNPYGGFSDVYSVDIERGTVDPFMWVHPFNGEPIPFRVSYTVETAGPDGTLSVPSDALVWDAENDQWKTVGSGVTAKSKVEFDLSKLIGTKWHHGITITWADVIAAWGYLWELAYDTEKSSLESSIAATQKPWFDTIMGVVFDKDNNKLIVYVDYWHFDDNYIAQYAVLGISNPVELHEAMFVLAFKEKSYALSSTRSRSEGIPQLNLILPDHVEDVKRVLQTFTDNTTIFNEVNALCNGELTMDEWNSRVQAAINWIDTYGLAWISDGPYKLVYFDKDLQEARLEAFRDPTYPFKPGDWLYGIPVSPTIVDVDVPLLAPGQEITITVTGQGEGTLTLKYILYDPVAKTVLLVGEATQTEPGTWTITLPSDVTQQMVSFRRYELMLMLFSDQVAIPAFKTEYIEPINPALYEQMRTLQEQMQALQEQIRQITEQIGSLADSLGQMANQTNEMINNLMQTFNATTETLKQSFGEQVALSYQQVATLINQTLQQQATLIGIVQELTSLVEDLSDTVANITASQQQLAGSISQLSDRVKSISDNMGDLASADDVNNVKSSVDEVKGTIGTIQALNIVVIILVIIAIALPFVLKRS